MSNTVKGISLNTWMDRYGSDPVASLFVSNQTKPLGNVSFNAKDEMGNHTGVWVPATFIPVDLTEQIPLKSLLESSKFKRLLSTNFLVIVDNESAVEFMRGKAAQKEYKRINNLAETADSEIQNTVQDGEEIELKLSTSGKKTVRFEGANDGVDIALSAFVERCADEDYSIENLEREFLSKFMERSKADLQYLNENVTRPEIREMIIDLLEGN